MLAANTARLSRRGGSPTGCSGFRLTVVAVAGFAGACSFPASTGAAGPPRLVLDRTIALPDVAGRIDHLAYDPRGRRLFVAELGNGTVDAVDLAAGRASARIAGLDEPQGLAWLPGTGQLAVASGDGSLRFYRGEDLGPVGVIPLGEDADNLRVDPQTGALAVGYGSGTIATVDPVRRVVTGRVVLPAHPEGFRVDGERVYVNLPGDGSIVAASLADGTELARWRTGLSRLNFPMAIQAETRSIAVAFRLPARLAIIDMRSGEYRQVLGTCGDSDDVFSDGRRRRLYVICGSGDVDVFARQGDRYVPSGRVATRSGARTGLLVAEEDRLFVAAPARGGHPAAILVYRPAD